MLYLSRALQPAVEELLAILTHMGVEPDIALDEELPPPVEVDEEIEIDETEDISELEAILGKVSTDELKASNADSFWDSLAKETEGADQVTRADVISYDQALQLGLAPEDE
jgi:hypothetical protein